MEVEGRGSKPGAGASEGGDLMSDLAAKLQLRRKGMAGVRKRETSSSGEAKSSSVSPLDKLSIIPPPGRRRQQQPSADDDDWD